MAGVEPGVEQSGSDRLFVFFYLDLAAVWCLCLEERGVFKQPLFIPFMSQMSCIGIPVSYPSSPHRLPALSFQSSPETDTHTQVRYDCAPSLSRALLIPNDLIVSVCQSLSGEHRVATCYFKPKLRRSSTSLLCYFYPISCPDVFILPRRPPPCRPHWQQKHGVGSCHR